MRVLILATAVLAILAGADAATAGPSTAKRAVSASVEPVALTTPEETEPQSGAGKTTSRGVRHQAQRRGHHHRIGGPIGFVGGVVSGLFGRR